MVFISFVRFYIILSKGGEIVGLQENIAANMRAIMERRQKSLTEFSEELGISRNALYDYIRCKGNPSIATVEHIAEKLGVEPAALMGLFELDQQEAALRLLDSIQSVAALTEEKRRRFVELFLEMVALWSD